MQKRFRVEFDPLELAISGNVQNPLVLNADDLASLPRVEQRSDFHCVTTWTKCNLLWSGFRFIDFYETIVQPKADPAKDVSQVFFKGQDGYRSSMLLSDLLSADILLADTLNNKPLSAVHGAPLRLIAPAHYGYKSAKHLKAIEFWDAKKLFRGPSLKFMIHPRGRVAQEERGVGVSGKLLRWLYRPLIPSTIRQFDRAVKEKMDEYNNGR